MRIPLLAVVLLTAACASPYAPLPDLKGTTWTLQRMNSNAPGSTKPPTLQFGMDGRASGDAGCNLYSGPYTQLEGKVTFGAMASTRRACIDPTTTEQENRYLAALNNPQKASLVNGELNLDSKAGIMVFARGEAKGTVRFSCAGGEQISVIFGEGTAHLIFPGGEDELTQTPTGSGFNYMSPRNSLLGKGEEVTWNRARMAPKQCRKL